MTDAKKTNKSVDKVVATIWGCYNISCTKTPERGEKFKVCQRCNSVSYCSKECQKNHWPTHKGMCNSVKENAPVTRRAAKLSRNLATLITIDYEPEIFDVIRQEIGKESDGKSVTQKALYKYINKYAVDICIDNISASIDDTSAFLNEFRSGVRTISVIKINSLSEEEKKLIYSKEKRLLVVRVIREDTVQDVCIYEGMKSESGELFEKISA